MSGGEERAAAAVERTAAERARRRKRRCGAGGMDMVERVGELGGGRAGQLLSCQPKLHPSYGVRARLLPSSDDSVLLPLSSKGFEPCQTVLVNSLALSLSCPDTLLPGAGNTPPWGSPVLDISVFRFLDLPDSRFSSVESKGSRGERWISPSDRCFLIAAMSNTLLRVYPSDLKMPFELKKQNSACLELVNKTDQRVAFKVKTTNPRKYAVRPASGVVPPRGSCGVTITMQAPKEIPQDYHCKDKFLVQSVIVEEGTTQKDIVPSMFSKTPGRLVEEFKLRVIYVPANPPSPVPEEAEEEDEPLDSDVDHEVERPSTSNSTSGHGHTSGSQTSHDEDVSTVSKSEDQEIRYAEENKKMQKELERLRKTKPSPGGFSSLFVLLVFSFFFLIGYYIFGGRA